MKNYNTISNTCEHDLLNFIKDLTNGLDKVSKKFVIDIVVGIIKSHSTLLSEIARKANTRSITIKKFVERLSRSLIKFNGEKKQIIDQNLELILSSELLEERIYIMDDTDLTKKASKHLEGLALVADGSDDHKLKPGYLVSEIVALNKKYQPISVCSKLYSSHEAKFKSRNHIYFEMIDETVKKYGNGTFIADRGYDFNDFYCNFVKKDIKFIIRAKKNRNIKIDDKKINIQEYANTLKGKINLTVKYQKQKCELKLSYLPVKLPCTGQEPIHLIVVKGFTKFGESYESLEDGMLILTNKTINNKNDAINIVQSYLSRWKVEEYFKHKKQEFDFENIRIRHLDAIRNLNYFLTIAINYNGILTRKVYVSEIISVSKPIKEKVAFVYYRISAGFKILMNNLVNIYQKLFPPRKKRERTLFTGTGIKF